MKLKEHTRNQKRMYRIHKQDEKIHDLELMIGKLQQENKKLNSAIQTYDILLKANTEENKRLKDNWDELKEIIRKKQDYYKYFKDNRYRKFLFELLNKMQELEGSDSNE